MEQVTPLSAINRWNCSLVYWADSTRCFNGLFVDRGEALVKRFGRFPAQRLAGSALERCGYSREGFGAMRAEVGVLGEVLVCAINGAALPGALRVAEIDVDASIDLLSRVLRLLLALNPR